MKVFIKTYGCQMNERDSEALAGMMVKAGHEITELESDADVMIFNTCSVRDQAERKAVGKISFMKKLKAKNPRLIIGVMGCMAQNRGEELFKELPHLDFVIGTGQLHKLPGVVEAIREERRQIAQLEAGSDVLTEMGVHYHKSSDKPPIMGQIAITRGCNRFCSYCIVPYVRGREISREISDIIEEARAMVAGGVKEILLLGQNVAAFGLGGNVNPPDEEDSPFADLLAEMCRIEGLERIRFTSPYVTYFNHKLIRTIAENPKIARSIHLPLQSGSNRILQLMNRQYTREIYLEKIAEIKRMIPEVSFSTDIIVGFPGETAEDFAETRSLANLVNYDNAYIFKYSPRSGTRAAEMAGQLPDEVKEERNQILLADLAERTKANNRAQIGCTVEVLAEGPSNRNPKRWSGKTSTNKTVIFMPYDGLKIGDLIEIEVKYATNMSLFGELDDASGIE